MVRSLGTPMYQVTFINAGKLCIVNTPSMTTAYCLTLSMGQHRARLWDVSIKGSPRMML